MTTGVLDWQNGQAYTGPVANVQNRLLAITTDNLSITATKPNNFIHTGLDWEDGQGADGFTGLALQVIAPGKPIASLTLASNHCSKADLSNGRLAVSFGNDPASGSSHMHVEGTACC